MLPEPESGKLHAAGGYGPPGSGGWGPPGGGYGAPPGAPPPPGGGGYGGPMGPPAGGFGGGPSFGAPKLFPAGPPKMPGAGGDVNTTLPLVLNIVGLLLCWGTCIGAILCVFGLTLALQARSLERQGDIDGARKKATVSTRLFVASALLGLVGYVVFFVMRPTP